MKDQHRTEEKHEWEAQYWWAFSCLVLAGRRNAVDFHAELIRRSTGSYPTAEQVETIVDEALSHVAYVFNSALVGQTSREGSASGWRKHVLALAMNPEDAKTEAADK